MKKIGFLLAMILIMLIPNAAGAEGNQLVIVNKATNQLAFYENGELVKTFSVGTGRSNHMTPEGTFPIVNKIKNRPYYSGGIPGGSPNNPLGDRWLGLGVGNTNGTTYAIHGNNNPDSIGKYVSSGCIRMHDAEVQWLFDRVNVGTNVKIVNSSKSFDELAKEAGYAPTPPIKIILDGTELKGDADSFIKDNRVLVPMRLIFDRIGATVHWDPATRSITATKKDDIIQLKVDSKQATINGKTYTLDAAPTIQQQRTFVPTRFVSEALGLEVKWDSQTRTVTLTTPKEPAKTPISGTVNGQMLKEGGFVQESTSMVQAKHVFSSIGVTPQFDPSNSTLTVSYNGKEMIVTADKKQATINGVAVTLPKAAVIIEGRFYVPAKTIAEGFAGTVLYDPATKNLALTLPKSTDTDEEIIDISSLVKP